MICQDLPYFFRVLFGVTILSFLIQLCNDIIKHLIHDFIELKNTYLLKNKMHF